MQTGINKTISLVAVHHYTKQQNAVHHYTKQQNAVHHYTKQQKHAETKPKKAKNIAKQNDFSDACLVVAVSSSNCSSVFYSAAGVRTGRPMASLDDLDLELQETQEAVRRIEERTSQETDVMTLVTLVYYGLGFKN